MRKSLMLRWKWLLIALACAAAAPAAVPGTSPASGRARLLAALRRQIRHVFVIYQENRSFDSYFGSYPGADNLATPQARRHGFRQYDPIGRRWVTPFPLRAADLADPAHDRPALLAKSDQGRMDRFIAVEEAGNLARHAGPAAARRLGLLTMAYEDCHTVPFLWYYARHFALYDHIFQGMYGPSTPGNIDLIAAQTGETQWARHPDEAFRNALHGAGEPVIDDLDPAFGPYRHAAPARRQLDQHYATLMLTLSGKDAHSVRRDTRGVRRDLAELERLHRRAIPWGWYQQGFSNAPGGARSGYIAHHNAPQYFGYLRLNPPLWSGVHNLSGFFRMLAARRLPPRSVSFIKGGLGNPFGWRPALSNPAQRRRFAGDDDHPGYSDSRISEALVAKVVSAVAHSPYWNSSAIFIVWDDSGGFYDHVPPPRFENCPDAQPCGDGPRVPLLLISPFARAGAVVSQPGDHASFAKFLDALFRLPPLATLPDERPWLPRGPHDASPRLSNLLPGFSAARLQGLRPPISAAQAYIAPQIYNGIPPAMSCRQTGVEPVSVPGAGLPPPLLAPAAPGAMLSSAALPGAAQAASPAPAAQPASQHPFSLAAFARRARAANAHTPPAARVFTNASLAHQALLSVVGQPRAPQRRRAAQASQKAAARARLKAGWQAKFAKARARLKLDRRELSVTQREFNLNQTQYYSNPNVALRQQYSRGQLNRQKQKIVQLKAKVAADQTRLDQLRQQLERAGLPLGWSQ